jgi:hypothetical protein
VNADYFLRHADLYPDRYQRRPASQMALGSVQQRGDFTVYDLAELGVFDHVRVIVDWGHTLETVPTTTYPNGQYPIGTYGLLANQHSKHRKHIIHDDGIKFTAGRVYFAVVY